MRYPVIFSFFIVLIIILVNQRFEVYIKYIRNDKHNRLELRFSIMKLIKLYKTIVIGQKDDPDTENEEASTAGKCDDNSTTVKSLYERALNFRTFYNCNKRFFCSLKLYIQKKLNIKKIGLTLTVGTGDAALTGLLSGALWSAAGSMLGYLYSNYKIKDSKLNIKPDFDSIRFSVNFNCIFNVKLVHIIIVGIRAAVFLIKRKLQLNLKKGGVSYG